MIRIDKKIWWILGLTTVVTIFLRLPSLFEPYSYADEGIYLVLGQAWRKGMVFYRDIHDNKPPFLYLTAGLAGNLFNFRLILLVWNLVNLWLVWLVAKQIFKKKFWPVAITSIVFTLASNLPFLEGNIANGEMFMIMPLTAAAYLILSGIKTKKKGYFLVAGFLGAIGFLFKVPLAFDLIGLGLFLLWDKIGKWNEKGKHLIWQWGLIITGFLIPNFLVGGYYWIAGAGKRYLISALLQNMPYLTSWGGGGSGGGWWQNGLIQRGIILLVLTAIMFSYHRKLRREEAFLGLWMMFSLYGALLSERPYSHYFIEVVPALSLLTGYLLVKGWAGKILLVGGWGLTIFSFWFYQFWRYPVSKYYQNFIDWKTGRKDFISYQLYWGSEVVVDQQVAEEIKKITGQEERIYVWGTAPGIYYLADRLPVGRYTVAYHVADFNAYEETITALQQQKPKLIVKLQSEKLAFPALEEMLAEKYRLSKVIGDREIYLRLIE